MFKDFIPGFLEAAEQSIFSLARLNKTAAITTGLLIPALVGIWCTYHDPLAKVHPALFGFPMTVFVAMAILGVVVHLGYKAPIGGAGRLLGCCITAEALKFQVGSLMTLQELIATWRSACDEYIETRISQPEDMRNAIKL